jgi:hypothetical protein
LNKIIKNFLKFFRAAEQGFVDYWGLGAFLFNKEGRVPHYQNSTVCCFDGTRRVSANVNANVDRNGGCPYRRREKPKGLTGDLLYS